MSIKEQLINDIKLLPEHTLQVISIVVKELARLDFATKKSNVRFLARARGKCGLPMILTRRLKN